MTKKLKIKKRGTGEKPLTKASSRYKYNAGHADDLKARSIKKYRKAKGAEFELEGSVVLRALDFLEDEVQQLPVVNQLTSSTEIMPVVRLTHAAKLLNVSYQTLWRWSSETEQLPIPVLMDNSHGREYPVYHLEELRVMVRTIGEHLTRYKYYRADHDATRNTVFAEIQALRAINYNVNGDTTNGDQEKRHKPRKKIIRSKRG